MGEERLEARGSRQLGDPVTPLSRVRAGGTRLCANVLAVLFLCLLGRSQPRMRSAFPPSLPVTWSCKGTVQNSCRSL
jgi:hypothetical protein